MRSRFIVTATPELQRNALAELAQVAPDVRTPRELKDGAFLVETEMPAVAFTASLVEADPAFIKHIMPVQSEVSLNGRKETDLPAILQAVQQVSAIVPGQPFSVQCRRIGNTFDYDAKDVEVFVGRHFEAFGAIPQFSDLDAALDDSQTVISIYLFVQRGYLGCSTVSQNLNDSIDEYRVFSHHKREVSRAEYKLLEALRKFRIEVKGGRALDLGAAPGGWTNVLAKRGMQVVAVDPAELAEQVAALPNVTHFKGKAEEYGDEESLDLIVDDMNVAPEQSAEMMARMAGRLRPGGFGIMTAKLVIRDADRLVGNIRPVLERDYRIRSIKNLFHNRRELTLFLQKK